MKIKQKFESLKLFQKIELYLLVIIFYGAVLYFSENIFKKELVQNTDMEKKVQAYQNSIKEIEKKYIKRSNKQLLKYLYEKADSFNINVKSVSISKDTIDFKFDGKFKDSMDLLNELAYHFKILSMELEKEESRIKTNIKLDKKYFFNPNEESLKLENIPNIFNIKEKSIKAKDKANLKLTAIVRNSAYIDGKWYKKDDVFRRYKVISIDKDQAVLKDMKNDKEVVLRVFKK